VLLADVTGAQSALPGGGSTNRWPHCRQRYTVSDEIRIVWVDRQPGQIGVTMW